MATNNIVSNNLNALIGKECAFILDNKKVLCAITDVIITWYEGEKGLIIEIGLTPKKMLSEYDSEDFIVGLNEITLINY